MKPGGLVSNAYDAILDIISQHKNQVEARRALLTEIKALDVQIAEQQRWFRANKHPIPKEGSGLMDTLSDAVPGIRDWIKKKSREGHEIRQLKRMDIILTKSNYLAKLVDARSGFEHKKAGSGVPKPTVIVVKERAVRRTPLKKPSNSIESRLNAIEKKVSMLA